MRRGVGVLVRLANSGNRLSIPPSARAAETRASPISRNVTRLIAPPPLTDASADDLAVDDVDVDAVVAEVHRHREGLAVLGVVAKMHALRLDDALRLLDRQPLQRHQFLLRQR